MKTRSKITAGIGAAALAGMLFVALQEPEPLPRFAYEGEEILGYSIPPRMYALIETPNQWQGIKLTTPECSLNVARACHVVKPNGIRLHINRCVDPTDIKAVKFDQESCVKQKQYNESFNR